MSDCSSCTKHVASGNNHACVEDGKVYPISDYPGVACSSFMLKETVVGKVRKRGKDPLENFIKGKLSKPAPLKTDLAPKVPEKEISLRSGAGWIVSAGLAGALIADVFIRLL